MVDEATGGTDDSRGFGATGRALLLPGLLAVTTGFVDTVGFLHLFGVFPANQSGNLVLFGMAFASSVPPPAWISGTSIVGFAAGAAVGAWLGRRLPTRRRRQAILALELVLLVALALADATFGATSAAGEVGPVLEGPRLGVLLLVASIAMGIQTEAIRRTAGVAISTTYQTGAMARIGETVAAPGRSGDTTSARGAIVVLSVLVACYVAGAALGAGPLGEGRSGLVVPCIAVAAAVLAISLRAGSGARTDS